MKLFKKEEERTKKFENLNQMDRIEYLLRLNKLSIDKDKKNMNPFKFLYDISIILILLFIVSLVFYSINKEISVSLIELISMIIKLTFVGFLILLVSQFINDIKFNKLLKNLRRKFLDEK